MKKIKAIKIQVKRERNLEVLNPLMKKGGLHSKDCAISKKKKDRKSSKEQLRRGDW